MHFAFVRLVQSGKMEMQLAQFSLYYLKKRTKQLMYRKTRRNVSVSFVMCDVRNVDNCEWNADRMCLKPIKEVIANRIDNKTRAKVGDIEQY